MAQDRNGDTTRPRAAQDDTTDGESVPPEPEDGPAPASEPEEETAAAGPDGDGTADAAGADEAGGGARDREAGDDEGEAGEDEGGAGAADGVPDPRAQDPAAAERSREAKATGRRLAGRYRLTDVVGRGGMGTVWRARDETLGRWVAVKELRLPSGIEDAERRRLVTRTMREAKAIASIRSRGVVTVYDVVEEHSRPWIVMELIEGRSLADVIRSEGPMPPARVAAIGLAILDVLRAAHGAGILHRDVKPSNVLVASEDNRVVLTDFGIAKVEGDPSVTSTGMLVGAPSYISPERARGQKLGPPTDMWSLGALLYCCVEGRPPYDEGGAIATLAAVMHDPVRPPRQAGPLTDVITGLLEKVPEDRLDEPRAREMLRAALAAAESGDDADEGEGSDKTLVVGLPGGKRPAAPAEPDRPAPAPAAPAGAATPAPPPPPAAPAGRPASTGERKLTPRQLTPRQRRLTIIALVSVVLLALLGTAIATTLGDDGDGGGQGGDARQDAPENPENPENEDGAGGGDGEEPADDGTSGGQDEPSPEDQDPGDAPPGTSPETDPGASVPGNPAGYAEVTDPDFHFTISLPAGWERTGIAGQNSGGIYSAPAGGPPKVQVDFTSEPGDNALAAWRSLEPSVRETSRGYELLGMDTVAWRGYPTVADWEFERVENGERVRVLNRGFRVDADHGYAIMITCPVDEWNGDECTTLRETAFNTFQPWDG